MALWSRLFRASPAQAAPRAQSVSGTSINISTPSELEEALRFGSISSSGQAVNADTALRVAAVFRCVTLRAGVIATLPAQIKRRVDNQQREDATDAPMWKVLNRRPNQWQKPAQFKKMMQAHVLLRGNAYAAKVFNLRGQVTALIPMHPDRVHVKQNDDLSIEYVWTRKDGRQVRFQQKEVFHLYDLTLNGYCGVTPITYARETIGSAMAMEQHGGATFRNGASVTGVLEHPKRLDKESHAMLQSSMAEFQGGGSREGGTLILEEGMSWKQIGLKAADAQWIEAKNFSRVEIAMFFGVPPHMIGHTDGNTKLGSSIESQTQSFLTFCAENDLVMWEEAVNADCLHEQSEPDHYMRFNRNGLVKGDIKTRWDAYVKGLQWGVLSPNRVLELEDENPRKDGRGDIYYDPPNTAGGTRDKRSAEEDDDDA